MNEIFSSDRLKIDDKLPHSSREQEVLSTVLDLMVEEGDGFSMASVARRASCSKETLYRWYGDRDGLLTATVKWQASKVIMPEMDQVNITKREFIKTLEDFAQSWLTVLTSDVSIALNRLAVSHAGNGKSRLGDIVLQNGPFAMKKRLIPIFRLGKSKKIISISGEEAFRLFFGLVVADTQIRVLLGDARRPDINSIKKLSRKAVKQFLALASKNSKDTTNAT